MSSIQFDIDFGDPDGTPEEMGCEEFENAQEIIDALKKDGWSVAKALDAWDLLDGGTVRVTFTPDIPEELRMKSVFLSGEVIPPHDPVKFAALQSWLRENQTTAEWSDFGGR